MDYRSTLCCIGHPRYLRAFADFYSYPLIASLSELAVLSSPVGRTDFPVDELVQLIAPMGGRMLFGSFCLNFRHRGCQHQRSTVDWREVA